MAIIHPYTTLQEAFSELIQTLKLRLFQRPGIPYPLVVAACHYLRRTVDRFCKLVAKAEHGPIPPRKPRAKRPENQQDKPKPDSDSARPKTLPFPKERGWVLKVLPVYGAVSGCHLLYQITQPEMLELLARAPTLGRLLRPLAHMLAIDLPEAFRLPRRKRRPAAPKPRKPRKPKQEKYLRALNADPSRVPDLVRTRAGGWRSPHRHRGPGRW